MTEIRNSLRSYYFQTPTPFPLPHVRGLCNPYFAVPPDGGGKCEDALFGMRNSLALGYVVNGARARA